MTREADATSRLSSSALPSAIASAILASYADIVRVGKLDLNGEELTWDTHGTTEQQLNRLASRLFDELRNHSASAQARDVDLHQAIFYICKSVSFNYALFSFMLQLYETTGYMSTIETTDREGLLVNFDIDATQWPQVSTSILWRRGDNILQVDPALGTRVVRGSLSMLSTEFSVPPPPNFIPQYDAKMSIKRRSAVGVVGTWCGAMPITMVEPDHPLSEDFPAECLSSADSIFMLDGSECGFADEHEVSQRQPGCCGARWGIEVMWLTCFPKSCGAPESSRSPRYTSRHGRRCGGTTWKQDNLGAIERWSPSDLKVPTQSSGSLAFSVRWSRKGNKKSKREQECGFLI
eukprot:CAMPEP_0194488530 /NCGR_PEP_ID=MMETSP0253-20130528/8419_1 /TAXON_ID=2966 /ORGANISM="Noctiluca scintillans" /LENGTH=348 /DNA_ID=CAMNT_0039328905 /DNA_START=74 /DNA_END=1120 /DNA_ORIENTATION=-